MFSALQNRHLGSELKTDVYTQHDRDRPWIQTPQSHAHAQAAWNSFTLVYQTPFWKWGVFKRGVWPPRESNRSKLENMKNKPNLITTHPPTIGSWKVWRGSSQAGSDPLDHKLDRVGATEDASHDHMQIEASASASITDKKWARNCVCSGGVINSGNYSSCEEKQILRRMHPKRIESFPWTWKLLQVFEAAKLG